MQDFKIFDKSLWVVKKAKTITKDFVIWVWETIYGVIFYQKKVPKASDDFRFGPNHT